MFIRNDSVQHEGIATIHDKKKFLLFTFSLSRMHGRLAVSVREYKKEIITTFTAQKLTTMSSLNIFSSPHRSQEEKFSLDYQSVSDI